MHNSTAVIAALDMPEPEPIPKGRDADRLVCAHEGGHAVYAFDNGHTFRRVAYRPGECAGKIYSQGEWQVPTPLYGESQRETLRRLHERVATYALVGIAAEALMLISRHAYAGAIGADIWDAWKVLGADYPDHVARIARMKQLIIVAQNYVSSNKYRIERVGGELLAEGSLTYDQVKEILTSDMVGRSLYFG